MTSSIHMYFYDKQRDLVLGDTVTFAQAKFGEVRGERAKLVKIAQRYAEFESTSGSRVKVYAQSARSGSAVLRYFGAAEKQHGAGLIRGVDGNPGSDGRVLYPKLWTEVIC